MLLQHVAVHAACGAFVHEEVIKSRPYPELSPQQVTAASHHAAGEFDVPLRMFYPDGSSPSFRLKIIAQGKA